METQIEEGFNAAAKSSEDSRDKLNQLRVKELESKSSVEFSRYKQDCRKRALDLAHAQVTSPKYQKFIQESDLLIKDKEWNDNVVQEQLLISMADKYYNWLISIPDTK